jgi:hypothetical protein
MTFRLLVSVAVGAALMAAAPQAKKNADSDPDIKEIRDYRLSMDALQKFANAYKAMMADSKAQTCFKDSPPGNEKSLDLGEKKLNECPAATADLKGAGLKTREFLVLTAHILGDMMAVELKRGGQIKAYPADTISPENAAFLDQNNDKMKALLAPMINGGGDK